MITNASRDENFVPTLLGQTVTGDVVPLLVDPTGKLVVSSTSSLYRGTWNATTNTPTIVSSSGTAGDYYIVSVGGTTNLDGTNTWSPGDQAIFNGVIWQKIPYFDIPAFNQVFNATTDWGGVISGLYYEIEVTTATHGKGTDPIVTIFDGTEVTIVDALFVAANGNVTFRVTSNLDNRFAGTIKIN